MYKQGINKNNLLLRRGEKFLKRSKIPFLFVSFEIRIEEHLFFLA